MSQPEARLSRAIMKMCRDEFEAWCFKVHGSEHQPAGIPDILGCYRGRLFGIETKMPGNKPSEIQRYRMREMRKAGGYVDWVDSVEKARTFMATLRVKIDLEEMK